MKVFVATSRTQGRRASDFFFAREGELVGKNDAHDDEPLDGSCGCRRSLGGLETGKSTTTFFVVEAGYGVSELAERIAAARADYGDLGVSAENFRGEAEYIARAAEQFDAGSVVERRGDEFFVRPVEGDEKEKAKTLAGGKKAAAG